MNAKLINLPDPYLGRVGRLEGLGEKGYRVLELVYELSRRGERATLYKIEHELGSHSQAYDYLKKLAELKLVEDSLEVTEGGLKRRIYKLTPEGLLLLALRHIKDLRKDDFIKSPVKPLGDGIYFYATYSFIQALAFISLFLRALNLLAQGVSDRERLLELYKPIDLILREALEAYRLWYEVIIDILANEPRDNIIMHRENLCESEIGMKALNIRAQVLEKILRGYIVETKANEIAEIIHNFVGAIDTLCSQGNSVSSSRGS